MARLSALTVFVLSLVFLPVIRGVAESGTGATPVALVAALPGAPEFPAPLAARLSAALSARRTAPGVPYVPRTKHVDAAGGPLFSNRLFLESSPYLLQHAHNPVNWYPWGDEAFAEAKRLGRPVLVSIGYSTCHWCHVMEEESFDDIATARYLNEHFVAIKVDREVRPDVDAIYMQAAQAITGGGGWPLNVWLNPQREPFYAGTYFPPQDGRGRPGFMSVLVSVAEAYATKPDEIAESARQLSAVIRKSLEGQAADSTAVPAWTALDLAFEQAASGFDPVNGGLGRRPKFPSNLPLRFLLRYHRRTGNEQAFAMVRTTLEKMAAGGLHDQVGGGFHRYSTDEHWLVPHFEKMLYDNALLAVAYLEAWQASGQSEFAQVARKTLDYVTREMTAPSGGFYSATDADSPTPEGHSEEGYFFTWTPAEIDQALGPAEARAIKAYYGVSAAGNFDTRNILHTARSIAEVASQLDRSPRELAETIESANEKLYRVRAKRPPPHLDGKILAAWNGLMISAFARAGLALHEPGYLARAERAADFVLTQMRESGRLRRSFSQGRAEGRAFLEDYAFLIAGLIDLYEADANPRWLREALSLQDVLDRHYADALGGAYFVTPGDHETLLAREKPGYDGAVPSGNSVAILNLLRLEELTTQSRYRETATMALSAFSNTLRDHPTSLDEMLLALDFVHDAVKEIVVVVPPKGDAAAMLAPLRGRFVPNRVLAVVTEGGALAQLIPLVADKKAIGGRVTAYVCENRVCAYPTSDPAVFAEQIMKVKAPLGEAP